MPIGACPPILVERDGDVSIIRLNDPATLNAVSPAMVADLDSAFDEAAKTSRAVVLSGVGRGFCSGANLASVDTTMASADYDAGIFLEKFCNRLMMKIRNLAVPLVTAVNGPAAGIGCSFGLIGDLVVASEDSFFLQAFRNVGLVPDGGSTWLLPHAVGRVRAMEMMLLGERVSAQQALAWGLVNRVTPAAELMDCALTLARSLASGPTRSLGLIRKLVWEAMESDFAGQLDRERDAQADAGRTSDHREGVVAFLERRPAAFSGH